MKLRNILVAFAAALTVFASCEKEQKNCWDEVQVSSSYVALPQAGGKTVITLTATDSWTFVSNAIPAWLTISPDSGSAGQTEVCFSASATKETNTATVTLSCGGKTQRINVLQQAEKQDLPITSVSDVLTKGKDATTYKVRGVCTKISNTQYGNWYINDGSSVEDLYIYGTLDATGSYNWASFNIEVGDIVTVQGPRETYNNTTIELKDASFISVEKSLIKCDSLTVAGLKTDTLPIEGGQAVAHLTCKGKGISVDIPLASQDWLQVTGINTATNQVSFLAAKNLAGDRSADITFKTTDGKKEYTAVATISQKGSIIDADCAGVIAGTDGFVYRVSGYVSRITGTKYGNFILKDASGEITIYGTNDWAASGIKAGDVVTVVGPRTTYGTTIELVNVDAILVRPVTDVTVAEFIAKPEDETLYRVKGEVSGLVAAKGRFDITDETGKVYAYNVAPGYGGKNTDFAATGVKDGDVVTVVGSRGSYNGTIELLNGFLVAVEQPQPAESKWSIDLAYTLGNSAYDDGGATINEESVAKVLKIGTSKAAGDFTLTVPAGKKKLTYYAVAWKGNATTLEFSVDGTVIKSQEIAANDGASGNAPYTITVADTDKYVIEYDFKASTQVKVTTAEGAKTRAIFFGIKAE